MLLYLDSHAAHFARGQCRVCTNGISFDRACDELLCHCILATNQYLVSTLHTQHCACRESRQNGRPNPSTYTAVRASNRLIDFRRLQCRSSVQTLLDLILQPTTGPLRMVAWRRATRRDATRRKSYRRPFRFDPARTSTSSARVRRGMHVSHAR